MIGYAVEENVTLVANDVPRILTGLSPVAPHADDSCRLACVKALMKAVTSGVVLLDEAGELLSRYRGILNGKGQPGTGDAFLRHIYEQQYNKEKVQRVPLDKDAAGNFNSFPSDGDLVKFDRADRIYVAIVRRARGKARILNAVDSDYAYANTALTRNGVKVIELCRHCLKGPAKTAQPKRRKANRKRK
jgi:hypothetical protein